MKRRAFLAGAATLAATPAFARELSWVATRGHADFVTAHLYPSASIPLRPAALAESIVALTFDDGPDGANDPEILRILAEHHAPATFFMVGRNIQGHGALVRKIADAGHEIGNHTYDHQRLIHCTPEQQAVELRRTNALIASASGQTPRWFRPPFGSYDEHTLSIAGKAGLETILWTVDSQDYREIPAERIEQRVVHGLSPGAVVLMHSNHTNTVTALPRILKRAKEGQFRFVTLSEWKTQMVRAAGV